MIGSYNANIIIPEQRLSPQLRSRGQIYHTGFEIDDSIAQWPTVFIRLLHKEQPYSRGLLPSARDKCRAKVLSKTLTGPDRECPVEFIKVKKLDWTQNLLRISNKLLDAISKFDRPGSRNKPTPCPNQKRISRGFSEPRKCPAHRRGTEPQAFGCTRDTSLGEHCVEGDEEVKVWI